MAARKKGNPVSGWIVLDKAEGLTSTRAVGAVRRLFNARKAGHAGTLDPLATGILPIALGEATKTVPYAVDGEKGYRFTVRWGIATDTDDAEGQPTNTSEVRPLIPDIEAQLPRFIGEILQTPPRYSAIKVDGYRAYDLAREGEEVELKPREVVIDALRLVDVPDRDTAVFEAQCGKGTYVRALARDLGIALNAFAHVIALRRTRVGPFAEADAVTLDRLQRLAAQADHGAGLFEALLPVEASLTDLFALSVGQSDAGRITRGQSILIRGRDAPVLEGEAYAICRGKPLAIGIMQHGEFRPVRVFNLV